MSCLFIDHIIALIPGDTVIAFLKHQVNNETDTLSGRQSIAHRYNILRHTPFQIMSKYFHFNLPH